MASSKSEKKKRKNKRKARTEVSPSPDPSSSSSSPSRSPSEGGRQRTKKARKASVAEAIDNEQSPPPENPRSAPFTNNANSADQAFADFYLRRATTEFADDLDKLRSTGDFHGQRSVDVLVAALKQGTACFGRDERLRIGSIAATTNANNSKAGQT